MTLFRGRRSQIFFKVSVFKNFAIFTEKHLCWNLFLIKLQIWRPVTWFSSDYWEIFNSSFFIEDLRWLLLIIPCEHLLFFSHDMRLFEMLIFIIRFTWILSNIWLMFICLKRFILRSYIKRQASATSSDNEWQRMATSDNEWCSEWQRMTTIDNKWQRVTTNGNEWQRVRAVVQLMKTSKNGWLPSFEWQKRCATTSRDGWLQLEWLNKWTFLKAL